MAKVSVTFEDITIKPLKPIYSMIPERYEYVRKRTCKEYFFYSEGPRGCVRKVVRFHRVSYFPPVYNLVLGDWNEKLNDLDSTSVTGNGDTDKVLMTVAAILIDFTDVFWDAVVRFEGNTPARSRLYQMSINRFFHEIEKKFDIYGATENTYEPFRKNISYSAFYINRKESLILEEPTETYMTPPTKKEEPRVYNDITIDEPELPIDETNSPYIRAKMESARRMMDRLGYPSIEDLRKLRESKR